MGESNKRLGLNLVTAAGHFDRNYVFVPENQPRRRRRRGTFIRREGSKPICRICRREKGRLCGGFKTKGKELIFYTRIPLHLFYARVCVHCWKVSNSYFSFLVCGSRTQKSPGTVGRPGMGGAGEFIVTPLSAYLPDISQTFCYFTCFVPASASWWFKFS